MGSQVGTPFVASNATLIDGTTPRAIKAAPPAGFQYLIHGIVVANKTVAETCQILIKDTAASPKLLAAVQLIASVKAGDFIPFAEPIVVDALLGITGEAEAAFGDTTVIVYGVQRRTS